MSSGSVFEEDFEEYHQSQRKSCKKRTLLEKWLIFWCIFLAFFLAGVSYFASRKFEWFKIRKENLKSHEFLPKPEVAAWSSADNKLEIGSVSSYYSPSSSKYSNICLTKSCVREAAYIISNINENEDPCNNFYKFACGGFISNTIIPEDKAEINTNTLLEEKLAHQIRMALEEKIKPNDLHSFKMAKIYFSSCLNRVRLEKHGLSEIKDILELLGGWPVIEDEWDEDSFIWTDSVIKFRNFGFSDSYFLQFSVVNDLKNSSYRKINIDQPYLGMSREVFVHGTYNLSQLQAYYKFQVDTAVLFGAERKKAEEEMKNTLDFEIELAKISIPAEKKRNESSLYNIFTIKEMQIRFPSVDWLEYVNGLLPEDMQVTENEPIILEVPEFLTNFEMLMNQTSRRTLANYHYWRAIKSSAPYLNKKMLKLRSEFHKVIYGEEVHLPRWKFCIKDITESGLGISVGSMYVRRYFPKARRDSVVDLFSYIFDAFVKGLMVNDWMEDKTKRQAIIKANLMRIEVGYPEQLLNDDSLEEFYKLLDLQNFSFFTNFLTLNKYLDDFDYGNLRKTSVSTQWIEFGNPAIINAFYMSYSNSIELPAGIMQGKNFDPKRPNYLNFGSLGWTIGHEIVHAFDMEGRQFDEFGNVKEWWSSKDEKLFNEKAKCFIGQFENFTIEPYNIKISGVLTQSENIADSAGINTAFKAYQNWIKINGGEKFLPGLDYNPEQLFFISAANGYCSKTRPETLKTDSFSELHPPDEFRVIGSFSNSEDFSKAFNCRVGSEMNKENKCLLF